MRASALVVGRNGSVAVEFTQQTAPKFEARLHDGLSMHRGDGASGPILTFAAVFGSFSCEC